MILSMWIVYDWLEKYHPEAQIHEGRPTISGVRYLAEDLKLQKEYLYIGYGNQYVDGWENSVICVNGTDLIFLTAPDIYVIFNEIQQMLEYYNSWENRMMQAMNEQRDLSYLLSITTPVLRTGIAVSDLSHKLLCHADYQGREEKLQLVDGYLSQEEMHIINSQIQAHITSRDPYIIQSSEDKDINYNIFSKAGNLVGNIISLSGGEGENVHSRLQLMKIFGQMMDLWFGLHEEALPELTLFRDVLEMKETDPQIISLRLEGMGWGEEPRMQLILLQPCTSVMLGIPFVVRFLEDAYPGVKSFLFRDQYVLVVNYHQTERQKFYAELRQLMEKQSAYCGCSHVFGSLEHLMQNYLQAEFAAAQGSGNPGEINLCEDYALEYMKDSFRRSLDTDISSPVLPRLREYDRANGTDYYHTLFVYLLCERNQTLAAKRLFIHRNTLVYRVNRIEALIDADLNDERERLYLLLSFFIKEDID